VVLVYRNYNSNSVLQQFGNSKTYYLSNNAELDYNFMFDSGSVEIYTEANFDQSTMTS
jgi:sucrose-6-phosphate hydrolase SacC (GH32 family)